MCSRHRLRAEHGQSLLETIMAMALLSIIMAAAYSSLITQMQTSAAQLQVSAAINNLCLAQRLIAEEIWIAGFGVPPNTATAPSAPPADIVTATANKFEFRTKLSTGHTYLTADAPVGATSLSVMSATNLPNGVTIYLTDTKEWYSGRVGTVSGNSVSISPALTMGFPMGSLVTPMDQVSFQAVNGQLQRNTPTTSHPIINNVTALNFAYDSSTLTAIRKIDVDLSVQTEKPLATTHQRATFSLKASVTPPDLKN